MRRHEDQFSSDDVEMREVEASEFESDEGDGGEEYGIIGAEEDKGHSVAEWILKNITRGIRNGREDELRSSDNGMLNKADGRIPPRGRASIDGLM